MGNKLDILCLDPAFRHLGWAMMSLTPQGDKSVAVITHVGVVCTEKQAKKMKILSADDNHRCSQMLADKIHRVMCEHQPVMICAESQQGSKNSHAAQLQGMAWGVVSAVAHIKEIPVLQVTPGTVKKTLCNRKDASKEDIESAVTELFPEMTHLVAAIRPPSLREHVFDAVAVGFTCLGSTEVQSLRRLVSQGIQYGTETEAAATTTSS